MGLVAPARLVTFLVSFCVKLASFWWVWWPRLVLQHFDIIFEAFGVVLVGLVAAALLVTFWYHFAVLLVGLVVPIHFQTFRHPFGIILVSFWWVGWLRLV